MKILEKILTSPLFQEAKRLYHKAMSFLIPFVKERPKVSSAIGVVLLYILFSLISGDGKGDNAMDYFKVTKGDFLVSIVEGGTLQAVNETTVRNEVMGNSRIVYIIPEGTYVKEGELIVELDTEEVERNLNQIMIVYEDDKADAIKAESDVLILKSTTESQIRKAELNVQFAEMDVQKFEEIEREQQVRNAQISIITAQESLKIAEDRLEWSEKLTDEGFETKSNLDKDKLSVTNQTLGLERAESVEKMLNEYDLQKTEARYRSNLKEAQAELERVKQQGESRISQTTSRAEIEKRKLGLSEFKLNRMQEQMEATKIYAPQDGLIVWASSSNRYSNESVIEEGAMIRMRQSIVNIPDTSEMKVEVKVHESHVNQVQVGQMAYIVLDAYPDDRYTGTVSKIGLLPDAASRYGNSNLKVYSTEIIINDDLPDIKPGASARAEIVITKLKNVLTVPIQCVTTIRGKQVCYVKGLGDPRPEEVEIGLFNNKFIEIKSGLKSGSRVMLAPPLDSSVDLAGALIHGEEEVVLPDTQPEPKASIGGPIVRKSSVGSDEAMQIPGQGGEGKGSKKASQVERKQAEQSERKQDAQGDRSQRTGGGGGGGGKGGRG